MSLEEQKQIVKNAGDLGKDLPGLNEKSVIDNILSKSEELESVNSIIEEEKLDNIDRGMSESDANKEANEQIEEAKNTVNEKIKQSVNEEISNIKIQYKIFSEGLETIPSDVQSTIANILLPPAIAVPAAAPNPIYSLNLAKTAKNALSDTLNRIILAFTEIIKSATKILYELPQSLLMLYSQLKTTKKLIDTIPL